MLRISVLSWFQDKSHQDSWSCLGLVQIIWNLSHLRWKIIETVVSQSHHVCFNLILSGFCLLLIMIRLCSFKDFKPNVQCFYFIQCWFWSRSCKIKHQDSQFLQKLRLRFKSCLRHKKLRQCHLVLIIVNLISQISRSQ